MESISYYLETSEIVTQAKKTCGIDKLNIDMTKDEIAKTMRWIGQQAPDTNCVDGKISLGRIGIGLMLSITIAEFPEFYQHCGLAQYN